MPEHMQDEEKQAAIKKVVDSALAQIMELGATGAQVFVTMPFDNSTAHSMYTCGEGCWYSRWGAIKEWVVSNEESIRIQERRKHRDMDE